MRGGRIVCVEGGREAVYMQQGVLGGRGGGEEGCSNLFMEVMRKESDTLPQSTHATPQHFFVRSVLLHRAVPLKTHAPCCAVLC